MAWLRQLFGAFANVFDPSTMGVGFMMNKVALFDMFVYV